MCTLKEGLLAQCCSVALIPGLSPRLLSLPLFILQAIKAWEISLGSRLVAQVVRSIVLRVPAQQVVVTDQCLLRNINSNVPLMNCANSR